MLFTSLTCSNELCLSKIFLNFIAKEPRWGGGGKANELMFSFFPPVESFSSGPGGIQKVMGPSRGSRRSRGLRGDSNGGEDSQNEAPGLRRLEDQLY